MKSRYLLIRYEDHWEFVIPNPIEANGEAMLTESQWQIHTELQDKHGPVICSFVFQKVGD